MIKNNKLIIILLTLFLMVLSLKDVSAQSINYYKNQNGVVVSQKEYQFIEEFYGEGYFNKMTEDDYNWIKDLNINNSEVEIKSVNDSDIMPTGTSYTQYGRKLTIVKSCSSNCSIIVKCTWNSIPRVKSYDVIGARLSGTSLLGNIITTRINSSSGTEYSNNIYKLTKGFGVSVKLPSSGTGISIEQKYTVSKGGRVYASYQHAKSNISLATSKLYTISSSGYGRVFSFFGAAANVFDEMEGVDVELS